MNKDKKIIKRIIKKGDHGHHGGAWKIAYADFVTAMMAFFLIMWLVNSVSIEQKKGIADYFSPHFTIIKADPKSDTVLSGAYVIEKESLDEEDVEKTKEEDQETEEKKKQQRTEEDKVLLESQDKLVKSLESNIALKAISEQVAFRVSDDGLDINIVDKEDRSMFPPGSIEIYDYMRSVIKEIAKTLRLTENNIGISGHTDSIAYANTKNYTNWELSADRANAVRRALEAEGVSSDRVRFVKGYASKELLDKENPESPKNRRITITILR